MSTALITGASSGIGAAFARQLGARGYDLVLVARRRDRLDALAGEISAAHGVSAIVVPADLTQPDAVSTLIAKLDEQHLAVDLLFNNAGFGTNGAFCDLALEREMQMIDVNCRSLIALSHAIAGRMRAAGRGTIIHSASLGGLSPTPYYATYGATKAFIVAFSEALAEELRPHGVIIKTLCPGATESEFEAASEFKGTKPPPAAMQSSDAVAAELLRSLDKPASLVITGRHNRLMANLLRFIPRSWALRASARSLRPQAA